MSTQNKYDNVKESKKEIFFNNIIGGVAWGLGATVGAAIILTVIGMVLSKINTIPVVGDYVENILEYVSEKQGTALDAVEPETNRVDKNE